LLLRKEGVNFRTTAEFEIVRTIKEKACYLANNPQKEETVETEKYQYTLPDGSTLEVWHFFVLYLSRVSKKRPHLSSLSMEYQLVSLKENPKCLLLI
jgi:hypothetical protein